MLVRLLVVLCLAVPLFGQTTPPPNPPLKVWNSSAGAGLALTSGNSDTQNISLSLNTAYDPKTDRLFKADALYLRGETNGEKQVDKASANARYERLIETRAFWFGELQYLRDPFKDISYLVSPLVGAGYHLVRTDTRKLTVDGAVGGVVESGNTLGSKTSGAVKAGQSFDWSISPASKFTQRLSGLWKTDDFSDALYHFDAGIAANIAQRLELKVSYVYDYKNKTPSPLIEKGDSALFAALLVKF